MKTISRRNLIKTAGVAATTAFLPQSVSATQKPVNKTTFKYCLNTSTIRGQNPGLLKYIEIAAHAGYDSVELWVRDIQAYKNEGNSLSGLRKFLKDNHISVTSAIGFAPWMVNNDQVREEGFKQMEEEMNMMAEIDCQRIAAPAAGVNESLNLFEVGARYKALLELGRKTGVMPQLEFWGASMHFYHLGQALMVAAVANDRDTRLLPDIYHLFRGGSGFNGLKLLGNNVIEVFHMNDFVPDIIRTEQKDKDRVYPGDGVAPMKQIMTDVSNLGGTITLSLELFNETYWQQDAFQVAKTGLEKMKNVVALV
jgi:2-keto-myo-inositol isomerase